MPISKTYQHIVEKLDHKSRCSDFLIGKFPGMETKNAVKKALKKEKITIDGIPATTGTWIMGGEIVTYEMDSSQINIWEKKIPVIYEDEYLAVVEKPAGIPTSGNQYRNLRNTLSYNLYPGTADDALIQPEPIHRLDKPTSGLVIVAKTWQTRRLLGDKMKYQGIQKKYVALVQGTIEKDLIIDQPIDGKSAITRIIKLYAHDSSTYGILSLVAAYPYTGRTHQIRIHLSGIGCPIVGDKLYNSHNSRLARGLMLHALALEFYHPGTRKKIKIETSLPKKFKKRIPGHPS